jgi:Kef-type K+ transport system membrane component KefB/nucleotide-binding universal stress UspA family protein
MEIFEAITHNDVLGLVFQVGILLLVAKLLGELSQKLGQPTVLGEILAGVLLGPSILGKIFPDLYGLLIPATVAQSHLIEVVSLLGAIFLLLVTGFETDLGFIFRHSRKALMISLGGLFLPLLTGFVLGKFLPDYLLADSSQREVFAMFIATAMAISAIPVIAKVLIDMNLIRRTIGQITIASGMIDDTIGWILLSVVLGMVSSGGFSMMSLFWSITKVGLFIILSFTLGYLLMKKFLSVVQNRFQDNDRVLSFVMVMTFLWAALAQALHLESIFGAFIVGIVFGRMQGLPHQVTEKIRSFAMGVFAPIFFALVGLKVDLMALSGFNLAVITLIVIFCASFGKIFGVYMVSRWIAKDDVWTALSYGAALNARGGMGIIVASIGLSAGILSKDMFSIIVVMAIVTSIIAPVLLRFTLVNVRTDEEEDRRIKDEEIQELSTIKNIYRVLIPVRYQDESDQGFSLTQQVKFLLLKKIAQKNHLELTLLSVVPKEQKDAAKLMLDKLAKKLDAKDVVKKIIESDKPMEHILNESQKDYDMLMIGTVKNENDLESLFSPVTDGLVRLSSSSITAVVYAKGVTEDWYPNRILVPTNGSIASKNAAEFAYFLSTDKDKVSILNVVERDKNYWGNYIYNKAYRIQSVIAHSLVDELVDLGEHYKVSAKGKVRIANDLETEIIDVANAQQTDLIIIGTSIKPASERLFLGQSVERILKTTNCPVLIINTY